MAKEYPSLTPALRDFIARQHIFFAATAVQGARINISPRSTREFRVIGDNEVCWLDLTGSGAETAAHLTADGRLTIMFCAFDGDPVILRLYGQGQSLMRGTPEYAQLLPRFEPIPGARQIVRLAVDLVQTSCGMGVPLFDYKADRQNLVRYWAAQGIGNLRKYWALKNTRSIDGLPTGFTPDSMAPPQ